MKSLTWIVGLLALILLSKQITATTVYIATTGSDITGTGTAGSPYASLSWAVSQAQNVANPDVTVLVGNGTYSGVANAGILLTYGSLTLQPNPANTEQTTFNIKSISTFFVQATNAQVTVSDITIRGGSALSGGQISVTSGRLVASNVFFENSTAATAGGAVLLNNSYGSSFSHCTFVASYTRNSASTGGQVALFNTDAVFSACSFIGGVAEQGGAVYLTNSLSTNNAPSFVQCTFVSNSAQLLLNSRASSVNGGAITVGTLPTNQTVVISDSTFDANSAPSDSGGSIYIYPLSAVSIDTSVFINGQAAIGGAIYSEKGSIVVTNTQFTNLTAQHTADGSSGKGGAIYIHAGYLTAINTSFSNNTAAENGGALAHNGGANHLTEADANDQTQLLGCVFSGNVAALNGGAIYLSNLVNPVNITTTNFISNRANAAGQFVGGGAILASGVHLEVNGLCSFEGNTAVASMGGAIYYEVLAGTPAPNSTNPLSVISGAHFTNNLAAVGGALCVDGLGDNQNGLYITGSRFAQNSANSFNTLKGQGGAIMGYNTTTVVSNSVFYDNRASDQGGALWFGGEIPSSPHCLDCAFFGNVVANQGTGTNAFLTGQTDSVFVGSNETLDQEGVQFVVSGSGASLTVSVSNSEPDANCYFTAITVTKNASLFLNCTATIKSLNFDLGLVTLQTSAFLNLIDFSWSGGVFSCPAHGVITLQASVKGGAYITNDGAKALNNCNFVNNGNTRFTNFPGGQLVDLQLMADSQLFNFNFISFAGHVVLNNEGNTPIMFENQGTLSIESTLALTTRSANFDLAMVGNKKNKLLGLYIHLINLNSTFTIGNQIAHKSTEWTQYTALDVASTFNANGALQIIFPDHWTGTWSNLIAFRSITGSFTALRSQSYRKNHYVGHRTKQIINSNSISIKIADSSNDLTGGQIFGIIFGTFAIVAVIALVVWYFYRKRGDQETYERLDRPAYGTV